MRIRWDIESNAAVIPARDVSEDDSSRLGMLASIRDLIIEKSLTAHYQPIYSTSDGAVFGFEALARLTPSARFSSLADLFQCGQATGSMAALDVHCMLTALQCLDGLRFTPSRAHLCINSCPETLMNPDVSFSLFRENLERLSIPPDRIILEITEESAVSNYGLFSSSLKYLREQGYKIAIDDFGAGYAGLKMLSTIEPDFLKIDRHFISNIDRTIIKFNLVDAIATACNRIGINIIAEGIERIEELEIITDLGIGYLQGFLTGRPSPDLDFSPAILPKSRAVPIISTKPVLDRCFIGNIVTFVEPIGPSESILAALRRFEEAQGLYSLPIVEDKKVLGTLNRKRFFENQVIDIQRYGAPFNSMKRIADVMEQEFVYFDVNSTLQEASKKISARSGNFLNDNLVVLKHGYYYGMVEISLLLDALTEQTILLAKDSNPLSGLPGNNTLQREITRRLAQNMHFDVLYIDIDHFKPFNDYYGFARGDLVIIALANIIRQTLEQFDSPFNFAGHIGGDDFILMTRPAISLSVAQFIIDRFTQRLDEFHGVEDYKASCFASTNRRGEIESFGLLSLSIGIVSTEVFNIASYSQLASISCEVKRAAKLQEGSSIVRDRRLLG